MAIFNRYPYTSFQELNLDWILQELKDLTDEWAEFEGQYEGITADAQTVPYGSGASVVVTGGDGQPFNFDFNIPAGQNITVVSTIVKYGTSPDTLTQPGTWYDQVPVVPQSYYLWTRVTISFSDGTQSTFYTTARSGMDGAGSVSTVNNISPDAMGNVSLPLPQPSNNIPLPDTSAGSEGVSTDYSRSDHQHKSDPNKQDVLVSGTNIKTINSDSLLGSGDITVQEVLVSGTNIQSINNSSILTSGDLSLQETLVSGTNIKTVNNQSLLGSGDLTISAAPSSFVGMVVSGTNLATEADVKAIYGAETSWTLISSVMLASENVFGNGKGVGLSNGNTMRVMGTANNSGVSLSVDTAIGANVGSSVSESGYNSKNAVGVPTKALLSGSPENSGLITDTVTVYSWERTL